MHVLLEKLLKKRGIDKSEELGNEKVLGQASEKEMYEEWNRILSRNDELKVEDIKEFCQARVNELVKSMRNKEDRKWLVRNAIMLDIFSSLLEAIDAPKAERERLEQYVLDLINN